MSAKRTRKWLALLGLIGACGLAWALEKKGGPPPDAPRDLKPTGSELGSLYPDVEKFAGKGEFAYSFLGDRFAKFDEHKKASRERVFELLRYSPEKVPPRAEVLKRVDCGDHVRESVVFSTSPQSRVPAYVLIPKNLKKPAPAIIDLHSHGGTFLFGKEKVIDLGDNHPAMKEYHEQYYGGRPTATALVKRGYVVISIDALFFGERRLMLDGDLEYGWDRSKYDRDQVKHLNQQCRSKEATLVKGLTFSGVTWPGVVFWDDMRTVDYLLTRKEVDPKRIGCVGLSMGGYRTMYLAALDDRVKAACVVGFMSTVRPMTKAHLEIHSLVNFLPGLHAYLDWPDVAALHAPKPLLVQQCSKDKLFPLSAMKDSVEKIEAIYKKAGAKGRFTGRFYDEPHRFTKKMQDEAFDWFDKELKGE